MENMEIINLTKEDISLLIDILNYYLKIDNHNLSKIIDNNNIKNYISIFENDIIKITEIKLWDILLCVQQYQMDKFPKTIPLIIPNDDEYAHYKDTSKLKINLHNILMKFNSKKSIEYFKKCDEC